VKRVGGMAQVIEYLLSKNKFVCSNLSITKIIFKNKNEEETRHGLGKMFTKSWI
jgi:hypothetical protein